MHLPESWLTGLLFAFDAITLSPSDDGAIQQPLLPKVISDSHAKISTALPKGPEFPPPSGSLFEHIVCDYTAMKGYKNCSTPGDRSCWLKGPQDAINYTIKTDYERYAPPSGVTRKYYLEVTDASIAPDGIMNDGAKLFNGTYPGPWIQACWGDDLEITVKNMLDLNGTTIHWHGIRMNHTVGMDGVNGITQCPIAPNETFTYKFKAIQYGTSWYHSHYGLQYGDGMAGPLTIHGPSSADYDMAIRPTMMTDWAHRSAFDIWWDNLHGIQRDGKAVRLNMDNILLNGTGNWYDASKPNYYTLQFQKGTRYLLRLINTSVNTAFVFAIDNHKLTVMSSDFVPINPYVTDHILIGIGQRYHIVIEAQPTEESEDGNYWLRTIPSEDCSRFNAQEGNWKPNNETGIVRYEHDSTAIPTTSRGDYSLKCRDEPYDSLVPILPWKVGPPSNLAKNSQFEVGLDKTSGIPFYPETPEKQRWNMFTDSMWLNFADPTLMNINKPKHEFDNNFVVITEDQPKVDGKDAWVYLLVSGDGVPVNQRFFPPAAHPIHLHGHDFAILEQSDREYQIGNLSLNLNNPPRRDVALLPAHGYLVLAFKADNPGAWLMHCHIAWHASGGLALQILENQANITMPPEDKKAMEDQCTAWKDWAAKDEHHFLQDDSGI